MVIKNLSFKGLSSSSLEGISFSFEHDDSKIWVSNVLEDLTEMSFHYSPIRYPKTTCMDFELKRYLPSTYKQYVSKISTLVEEFSLFELFVDLKNHFKYLEYKEQVLIDLELQAMSIFDKVALDSVQKNIILLKNDFKQLKNNCIISDTTVIEGLDLSQFKKKTL